ncbi:MAG: hypothetical protein HDS71_04505 [Bacteroidales bacterium]|nr:hypothetical protein [Bacteroidales bacterium]
MEKEKESVSASSQFRIYTGTKTIKAARMGAGEAKRHGAAITEETVLNNIGNDGYLVEYPDGYRSWSPKKAFDDAYKLSETKVDRMRIELADLNMRMKEVTDVLYNPYGTNTEKDRWYLDKQLDAMREYADALSRRIEYTASQEGGGK